MNPRPLAFTRRTALLAAAGTLAPVLDARAAKAVQPAKPADHAPTGNIEPFTRGGNGLFQHLLV